MNQLADSSPIMLKNCRHGLLLFVRGDQYIGRSLEPYGEFSALEADLFVQVVCPGDGWKKTPLASPAAEAGNA